jgi:Leucine-rich repeat (LRR) protein
VTDLSPLEGMPLQMLWLNGTPVRDITPLRGLPLVSLTLADTKVADISPLKGHPMQRLHIAGTEVTDLSPLQWMQLTRLVFTPSRIKTGLEYARNMKSLEEIGVDFNERMRPAEFWRQYDAGKIK